MALIDITLAILATYRIAQLLPEDDGPFYVFKRIRSYVATKAMNENDEWGFWAMVDDGINCPMCCGLYAAVLVTGLVVWHHVIGNFVLLIFALAGGQSLLQIMGKNG